MVVVDPGGRRPVTVRTVVSASIVARSRNCGDLAEDHAFA